jgi:hypothetical protein
MVSKELDFANTPGEMSAYVFDVTKIERTYRFVPPRSSARKVL